MDPAEDDRRVRDELARELRPRLDAIEAAVIFAAVVDWPHGSRLLVKREVPPHGFEVGVILADGRPIVEDADGVPIAYLSFEDMAMDGWRPD